MFDPFPQFGGLTIWPLVGFQLDSSLLLKSTKQLKGAERSGKEGGVQEAMNSRELEKKIRSLLGLHYFFWWGFAKGQTSRPIWKLLQLNYHQC